MSSFVKTCISETLLLAALAVPVFGVGCERQSDPPIEPRSAQAVAPAEAPAPQAVVAAAGAPDAEPTRVAEAKGRAGAEDAAITARVKTALMADDEIKGLAIEVATRDGAVTLTGKLDHQAQVAHAVDLARSVEGVRDVVNRLTVKGEDKAATTNQG